MTRSDAHQHQFPLLWLLQAGFIAFAFYVVLDKSYLQTMFDADKSYLSTLIIAVFLASSGYVAWHLIETSRRIEAARRLLEARDKIENSGETAPSIDTFRQAPEDYVAGYVTDVAGRSATRDDSAYIFEIYADRLRSPVETAWYIVDILIRLGLIGTIVGFILILGALSDGPVPTGENIQSLLITMSGGMGTALYTTLAGLVAATLLGLQSTVLGRCVEQLIGTLIRIRERADTREAD